MFCNLVQRLALPILVALATLTPIRSDALVQLPTLPGSPSDLSLLVEEVPEYVAVLVETPEGLCWVICRNDPINNTDPLGLVGNAPGKQMGLVDGKFNYAYANQWYEPEPLMAAVNIVPLALNTVDLAVNSTKEAIDGVMGPGYGDATEAFLVLGTAGITKVPRLVEGTGFLVSKVGSALGRGGRYLANGMKWRQVERPFGPTIQAAKSTGGRLGSQTTRAHVADVATEMESRGWQVSAGGGRLPEEYLPGLGGARAGSSFPDITATKNGRTLRVNTIDTYVDAITPTTREAANAARIRAQTGEHLLLVPKPKP